MRTALTKQKPSADVSVCPPASLPAGRPLSKQERGPRSGGALDFESFLLPFSI